MIVPDGGPGGGPCLRLMKKGYFSRTLEGLDPNTPYAATACGRGEWFRFGAGRYGFCTDHISINSALYVARTIGFTTRPNSTSVGIYFLPPATTARRSSTRWRSGGWNCGNCTTPPGSESRQA